MLAIFKRELRSCFHGMIGAVLTAFMLAATAIYFVALNLGYGLPDFGYYTLCRTIFVLLLYIPVLTMRSFAEERHSRTDQLLLTSPVSVGGIVLGKYFALCVIFALPCLVDAGMILVLKVLGATGTSTLANFSALLCYYLMGCAAIAIGAGIVHRHCRRAQCGGGAAQQKLYAGLSFLCGVLRGAYGAVSAQEQLADRGLQCGAQRPVPVYPL